MAIRCGCGADHGDGAALPKIGWQSDGAGGALLLANCPCGSTVAIDTLADASLCTGCRRLVTGCSDDVKIAAPGGVLCVACARRSQHAIVSPYRRYAAGS